MRKIFSVAVVLVAAFFAQACGSAAMNIPAFPVRGQAPDQMSRDMAECDAWARQQTGYAPAKDTIVGAVIGGVGGAAVGAAIGAVTGNPARGAMIGAAGGGVLGGAAGYAGSRESYERAYAACMSGRGYSVAGGGMPYGSQPTVVRPPIYAPRQPIVVVPEDVRCRPRYGWYHDPADPMGVPYFRPIPGQFKCDR